MPLPNGPLSKDEQKLGMKKFDLTEKIFRENILVIKRLLTFSDPHMSSFLEITFAENKSIPPDVKDLLYEQLLANHPIANLMTAITNQG